MMSWRVRDIAGETVRNLGSGWPRTAAIGIIVAGLIGAFTWSELATSHEILAFQREFVGAGGNVLLATHSTGLPIEDCVALASAHGVAVAGASAPAVQVETTMAPGVMFLSIGGTSGALKVWQGGPESEVNLCSGIVVGSAMAFELGLADGAYITVGSNSAHPVAIADIERRYPQGQRSIIYALPPAGEAPVCWVEMVPGAVEAGEALLSLAFAQSGPDVTIRPLTRLGEFARDPIGELANRPQARAWVLGGLILTLLLWLDLWFRRGVLGLYRVLGTRRSALLLLAQTETFVLVVSASLFGFLWAAAGYGAFTGSNPVEDQYLIALRTAVSLLAIPLLLGPLPALLTGARGGLLSQLKER